MTAPADQRCHTCDRPKCDFDERRRVQEGGDRADSWCYDYWFDDERCHHLRVDWRGRCLEAEANEKAAYDNLAAHAWNMGADDATAVAFAAASERAVKAEAEALASRALLREAERNVAIVGPRSRDLDLAARIHEHLRGL